MITFVHFSYKRIYDDFGIDALSDFCFTHGENHSPGSVHVYATGVGSMKAGTSYPGYNKFSDEGGKAIKGNLIYYIEPDVSSQYD